MDTVKSELNQNVVHFGKSIIAPCWQKFKSTMMRRNVPKSPISIFFLIYALLEITYETMSNVELPDEEI